MAKFHFLLSIPIILGAVHSSSRQQAEQASPSGLPTLVSQSSHSGPVHSMAFCPKNACLVTGGDDGTIRIWEIPSLRLLRQLESNSGAVTAVTVSSSGEFIMSGANDGTISKWTLATGVALWSAKAFGRRISQIAVSSDGATVAAVQGDSDLEAESGRRISIRHAIDGREMASLQARQEFIDCVALSRDASLIVVASSSLKSSGGYTPSVPPSKFPSAKKPEAIPLKVWTEGYVEIWDIASKRRIASTSLPNDMRPNYISFPDSPDTIFISFPRGGTQKLVLSQSDTLVKLTEEEARRVKSGGCEDMLYTTCHSQYGQWSVSAVKGTLSINSAGPALQSPPFPAHQPLLSNVVFSPSGRLVAIADSLTKETHIWNLASCGELYSLSEVEPVAFEGDSHFWGIRKAGLVLYDAQTGEEDVKHRHLNCYDCQIVSSNMSGPLLVEKGFRGSLKLFNAESNKPLGMLQLPKADYMPSQDSQFMIKGRREPRVEFIDGGRKTITLADERVFVSDITAAAVDHISFYDKNLKRRYIGKRLGQANAFAVDSSGDFAAIGYENGGIAIWDLKTTKELVPLKPHPQKIDWLLFNAENKSVLAISNGTVSISESESSKETCRAQALSGRAIGAAFSAEGRWFAVAYDRGILEFRQPDNCSLLVSLSFYLSESGYFSGRYAGWLATNPSGLFDGTVETWNRLAWRTGDEIHSVAQPELFYGDFFYPGLLCQTLEVGRVPAPKPAPSVDRRQPAVHMTDRTLFPPNALTPPFPIKLEIDVEEVLPDEHHAFGSGAKDLRVFRNGRLVRKWSGDILDGKHRKSFIVDFPRGGGGWSNDFSAYAFNRDGVMGSTAHLNVTDESKDSSQTLYVVAIGVSDYGGKPNDLRYAASDAEHFAATLEEMHAKLKEANKSTSTMMTGDVRAVVLTDSNATREGILSTLRALIWLGDRAVRTPETGLNGDLSPLKPRDQVILYFAGHGFTRDSHFYFLPYGTKIKGPFDRANESDWAAILSRSISDDELEQILIELDCANVALIIDSCDSGQSLEDGERQYGPLDSRGLAQLVFEKRLYMLTATSGTEKALELGTVGRGLLTYVLTDEGLVKFKADASPADRLISVREWLEYAQSRVPEIQTVEIGIKPTDLQRPRALLPALDGEPEWILLDACPFRMGKECIDDPKKRPPTLLPQ